MKIWNLIKEVWKQHKSLIIITASLSWGALGIIFAFLGYYMEIGWQPLIFFTWDLPFIIFWIWAIYKGIYKPLKRYNTN